MAARQGWGTSSMTSSCLHFDPSSWPSWWLTSGVSLAFNVGDGLMLLAAVLRAVMVTCTHTLTRRRDAPALALTATQTGTAGLGCLLLVVVVILVRHRDPRGVLHLVCVLCFAQNHALRRTSPTRQSFQGVDANGEATALGPA